MRVTTPRPVVVAMLVAALALTWAIRAHADGAVNIAACQVLNSPNTVYRLTADLVSSSDCLVVGADRITIDLQGHSITGTGNAIFGFAAVTDQGRGHDLIVVKNGIPGALSGFFYGISLESTRSSVISVEASGNIGTGIRVPGARVLVKSSVAHGNNQGISAEGDRAQIQQSEASNNAVLGISAGAHCLVTMNTANNNSPNAENGYGIATNGGGGCTISFNTASGNGIAGILTGGAGNLVTQNTAMGNGTDDFVLDCPGDVTFNTSSLGFPASYRFFNPAATCRTANNQ